jgi:hypothetical protein
VKPYSAFYYQNLSTCTLSPSLVMIYRQLSSKNRFVHYLCCYLQVRRNSLNRSRLFLNNLPELCREGRPNRCYLRSSQGPRDNQLTLTLTSCSGVFLEKLIVAQPVNRFCTLFGTRKFFSMFTRPCHSQSC